MRRSLIGIALSLSLIGVTAARADDAANAPAPQTAAAATAATEAGPANGPRAELHRIFAQLNLSADQKAQLKALRQQKMSEDKSARHELREAKHAFALALALTGDASDDAIRSAHEALAKKREADATVRFEGLLEVRRILTPEQRKKFGELYIGYRKARATRADGAE